MFFCLFSRFDALRVAQCDSIRQWEGDGCLAENLFAVMLEQ